MACLEGEVDKMQHAKAEKLVAGIARELAREHRDFLQDAKRYRGDLKRPDFLWHYMVQSFSTLGSSRGYEGLMKNPSRLRRVEYKALLKLPIGLRRKTIEAVFREAKLRRPRTKAKWLANNLAEIERMGGLKKTTSALFAAKGKEGKIRFLKDSFDGIGHKYSQNMMMDVYHPEFVDCIAVDARILNLSKKLV